jgi:predicted AAA+ superfamily ATPase
MLLYHKKFLYISVIRVTLSISPESEAELKYFNENAPQYQIVCADSLLGAALHPGTSFPVGKVEFLDLYPLSFSEFMAAMGKERFVSLLDASDFDMATAFKQEYIDLLKHCYFVGGMPEAALAFYENPDFNLLSCMARLRQGVLLDGNALFVEFKGALTERYVLQQLKTVPGIETYYWTNARNTAEVDFLLPTILEFDTIIVVKRVFVKKKRRRSTMPEHNARRRQ